MTGAREPRGSSGIRPLLTWAGLIALALLAPPEVLPFSGSSGVPGLDKAAHLALFFVLGALALGPARARSRRPVLAVVSGGILYGGLLEVCQGMLGWRSAELLDLLADGVGSVAGVAAAVWWRPT